MKTFGIRLAQTVIEESYVYIDANTREEAELLAMDRACNGDVTWQFLEANDLEIVSCEEAPAGSTL